LTKVDINTPHRQVNTRLDIFPCRCYPSLWEVFVEYLFWFMVLLGALAGIWWIWHSVQKEQHRLLSSVHIRKDRELRAQVRRSTEIFGYLFSSSFFITGLATLIFYFLVEARGSRTSSTWILVIAITLLIIGGLGISTMIVRRFRER